MESHRYAYEGTQLSADAPTRAPNLAQMRAEA